MKRVRCPRCASIIQAAGTHAVCTQCGATGRITPPKTEGAASGMNMPSEPAPEPTTPPAAAPAKPPRPSARERRLARRQDIDLGSAAVIVLDFRRLAPSAWPSGYKVGIVASVLLLAFVFGGYAGYRINESFDSATDSFQNGKNLLSGNKNTADINQDPVDAGTATGDTGGTDPGTDPGSDPGAPSDPGSDPGGSSDPGNSSDPSGPSDPGNDPGGDPGGDPPPPTEQPGTMSYSGSGRVTTANLVTELDLLRFTIVYYGDHYFELEVWKPDASKATDRIVATEAGDYVNKVRYLSLPAGEYYFKIDVPAGTWDIDLDQPIYTTWSSPAMSETGNGDGSVGPVKLSADHLVEFDSDAIPGFEVIGFAADGSVVCELYKTDAGSMVCDHNGPVVFDIQAAKGDWTLVIHGQGTGSSGA